LLYASGANTLARLAKDTNATRYLSNTGTSNNPAWAQINLTNGVTGILPVANGGTNASSASITAFNNITGYSASGATGTTTTNLVFSTSPTLTTPSITGNATLSTGNITQGTAAKGFNFSANTPASGMTSQLLNWYEEGTFTPNQGGGLTVVGTFSSNAAYTRIGRVVTVIGTLNATSSVTCVANGDFFTNLPFAAGVSQNAIGQYFTNTKASTLYGTASANSVRSFDATGAAPSISFQLTYMTA
jgi:hypothetical protein